VNTKQATDDADFISEERNPQFDVGRETQCVPLSVH
jgi:hypothetical protein